MMEGESIGFVRVRFRERVQPRQAKIYLPKLSASRLIVLTCKALPNEDADDQQNAGASL